MADDACSTYPAQVSAQRVVLRVPGTCMQLNGGAKETEAATGIVEVTVNFAAARQGQFWFDEDKSSASFSKKRKEITVSVGLRAVDH